MFGLLKENILNNLEKTYLEKGEKAFKAGFNDFIKIIKESKDLKKIYNMYGLYEDIQFDNEVIAREFVNESLELLRALDKKEISRIKNLTETTTELPKTSRFFYLDQLVFNDKISLKEKVEYKVNLINSLVKENKNNEKLIDLITNADTRINESLNTLTEEQINVVNLLVENDSVKINDYYIHLVNETQNMIDDKIIGANNNVETITQLVEAKKKLKTLSSDANLSNIELILDLKGIL